MADYYPLLARALDALPDRSPAMRKAVYDRARAALIGQLRSLDPPLSEADIDLERRALDVAIGRLEVDHGGSPPAAEATPAPAPAKPLVVPEPLVIPAPPAGPAPPLFPAAAEIPEPAPPSPPQIPPPALPPAAPARFQPLSPHPDPEPREAAVAIAARRPRTAAEPAEASPPAAPDRPPEAIQEPEAASEALGRQRPRIAVVRPRGGRSRILRNAFVGTVLAVVIGLIAVAAFLLRDTPQTLQATGPEAADAQQADAEAKFGDRVGGDAAPAAPRPDSMAQRQAGQAPAGNGAGAPAAGLSVAQRAVLIEESTGGEATPTTTAGRVAWRLDSVNGDQGQPLQTAVIATVTYPDAGLTLTMTIQRNLDPTLPASHTVSLDFAATGPGAAARTVQDVGLLQAKEDDASRGSPVSGLPVRVRDNLFLIGLSSLRNDVERNTELLLRRNWFDLAVRYASGKRAVLTFEKGATGTRVMQSAFDAWQ